MKATQDVRRLLRSQKWSRHLYACCRSRDRRIVSDEIKFRTAIYSILTAYCTYYWTLMLELVFSNITT
jgi:hypothetical protein